MQSDSSYSPVLWGAVVIPIVSGTELFIDPQTRGSFGFFVLGFFYVASIRYTLAVALGVYAHEDTLERHKMTRIGVVLWICYFMMLILCSLLVPGAAIFGLGATIIIAIAILVFSITQGFISLKTFQDTQKSNTTWRLYLDFLILIFMILEIVDVDEISFQAPSVALVVLLVLDFSVNKKAKSNLLEMVSSLKAYFARSWRTTVVEPDP